MQRIAIIDPLSRLLSYDLKNELSSESSVVVDYLTE